MSREITNQNEFVTYHDVPPPPLSHPGGVHQGGVHAGWGLAVG